MYLQKHFNQPQPLQLCCNHCIANIERCMDVEFWKPLVLVIAWVAVKFGINTTSVVLEIYHSNTTLMVFIPYFTAIPMLFPVNTTLAAYMHAVH